jgi:hypothetical protein
LERGILPAKFKYKPTLLSEEHIQQMCKFLKIPYVKGKYQKWNKFSQFKFWHKKEMDKRDK